MTASSAVPNLTGSIFEKRATNSPFVEALINPLGVEFAFLAEASETAECNLREELARSRTAGIALIMRGGAVRSALRKSYRTGDIDISSGFAVSGSSQEGFQFKVKAVDLGGRTLRLLDARLENVLFEVHSALRDIDGLHAPDALDEICKLIYAKIFDEENALKVGTHWFQRSIYSSSEECGASIRQLYFDAVADDESVFSNRIPSYARSRGVFRDPITLSDHAIAKTVSLLEEYDIGASPVDIKGRAFQNVLMPATRSGMGQYFTPKSIINLCVDLLRPTVRDTIIDPFCGSGHFLTAALDHVRAARRHSEKQFHEFAFSRLHGLEKSDRMVRVAMTDMRLHGDGHSNIRCVDSLLPYQSYADLNPETFDIVATNPPFGVDLPIDAITALGPFEILRNQKGSPSSVSLEVLAIDRCMSLLRPGGRMAIVLPDGILSNKSSTFVRNWLQRRAKIRAIISLPMDSFSPFGANIKTSVLIVRKLFPGEPGDGAYDVFMSELVSIGHDASGRKIPCDDFGTLANAFGKFTDENGW